MTVKLWISGFFGLIYYNTLKIKKKIIVIKIKIFFCELVVEKYGVDIHIFTITCLESYFLGH